MTEQGAGEQEQAPPGTPRGDQRRNPLRRVALLAIFALTLPFTWGESSSCNGPPKSYTGIELFTKDPHDGIRLLVLFLVPVLLGLMQHYMRNTWARLAMEVPALFLSLFGTLYCFLSAVFAGDFSSRHHTYLAPWIAMVASFFTAVEAARGVAERIADLITAWQQRRALAASQAAAAAVERPPEA